MKNLFDLSEFSRIYKTMDRNFFLLLLVLVVSMPAVHSEITAGPKNDLKKIGESTKLICITDSKNCHQVDWQYVEGKQSAKVVYRNDTGMLNNNDFPTTRYSVSDSSGGCTLAITQMIISDSGRYICMQTVGTTEVLRSAVLVVVDVKEACQMNLTNLNDLAKDDAYNVWFAIDTPPKSVEPTNLTLKIDDRPGTSVATGSNTILKVTHVDSVKGNGTVTYICSASLVPSAVSNADDSATSLEIGRVTQDLVIKYSLTKVEVFPLPPYHNGSTVTGTADGFPAPTFKWVDSTGTVIRSGSVLTINGNVGDKFTCIATNIIRGQEKTMEKTIEVSEASADGGGGSEPDCGGGCVAGIIVTVVIVGGVATVTGVYVFVIKKKKENKGDGKEGGVLMTHSNKPPPDVNAYGKPSGPPKPARSNDPQDV